MRVSKAKKCVRRYERLEVVFESYQRIFLISGINRFLVSPVSKVSGDYRNWASMWRALRERQDLDMTEALAIVRRNGFNAVGATRIPDYNDWPLIDKKVKVQEVKMAESDKQLKHAIIIWAKVCLACEMNDYRKMVAEINNAGYFVVFRRTTIAPNWHEEATKAWGDEDYPPFAEMAGRVVVSVDRLWKDIKKSGAEKVLRRMIYGE